MSRADGKRILRACYGGQEFTRTTAHPYKWVAIVKESREYAKARYENEKNFYENLTPPKDAVNPEGWVAAWRANGEKVLPHYQREAENPSWGALMWSTDRRACERKVAKFLTLKMKDGTPEFSEGRVIPVEEPVLRGIIDHVNRTITEAEKGGE